MLSLDTTGANALRRKGHSCGAVLISAGWALTAAHCLDDPRQPNRFPVTAPTTWRVTAGMHERGIESSDRRWWQVSGVRRFFAHYGFVDLIRSAKNDIALLQLSHPFILTPYIQPICLPEGRVTQAGWRNCFTAGWGTLAYGSRQYSLTLHEVEVPIVTYQTCRARFGNSVNSFLHLCAGDWNRGQRDSCKGDSGGPLACQREDFSWYLAGIVSWGHRCGLRNTPGVYTSVVHYEDWISAYIRYFEPESVEMYQRRLSRTRSKRETNGQTPFAVRLFPMQRKPT
uniref:prostasin isoform X2 n=1 Tax=Ciona intestinalis TaxID=7719 RepID=UPI000EF4405E|nr:prostasin isoform X2 [Ciona intestinalis]|eukprot:XP_026690639.1 prostasin isoform X2 [Ciona intestinalis]